MRGGRCRSATTIGAEGKQQHKHDMSMPYPFNHSNS
ncbi:hypothetical protein glysoja_021826 [Glycine soja]|nr:hypothetical protein glysoja_021826 [Glycine soja]